MSSRVLANLGFLLQIAGLLTLLPIGVGLYFNETQAVISLFIGSVAFLGCGFLCNSLCQRKDLDFKSSNALFLVAFILLPLLGSLPFIYANPFGSSGFDTFTNSFFESVSGFTTTGFSFISDPSSLPYSLLIYRSLTELMGGVGIVFLVLAFFQSRRSLNCLSNSAGIDDVCGSLKKTYFWVFGIYGAFILIFMSIFYALGFTDIIGTGTFIVDTLTGGFQPVESTYQQYLALAPKICILVLMFLGSVNFAFNYSIFARKFKNAFSREIFLYLIIIAVGTVSLSLAANIGVFDSLFHVVSMSSSTGQYYIPPSMFGYAGFSILIVIMLIGGCAFSMAGGIRVSRVVTVAESMKEHIQAKLRGEYASTHEIRRNGNGRIERNAALVTTLLFILLLVIFSIIFTTTGVSFTDALFEVGSALTTNGISMGATTVTMPIGAKWLMTAAMIVGRVEVLTILIAIFSIGQKK